MNNSKCPTNLTCRCSKNGIQDDNQCLSLPPSNGPCTDTTRLKVRAVIPSVSRPSATVLFGVWLAYAIFYFQKIYTISMANTVLMKRYPYRNGFGWPGTCVTAAAGWFSGLQIEKLSTELSFLCFLEVLYGATCIFKIIVRKGICIYT